MLILNGINLGERQKELNVQVNEAAKKKVDFEQVKEYTEQSDVDKLFKIDLASKYKNIEYIIEILKSGDSLYVSRALKCVWIYHDEFSNIINVDYLHHNIFPFMSLKMKKKMLATMCIYIRNPDRASAFYTYCMEIKATKLALKFLIFTNESFKLECLKNNCDQLHDIDCKLYYKHFIGSSFILADQYLTTIGMTSHRIKFLNDISYLYSISDEKYLDMLEKHVEQIPLPNYNHLGLRICKDILKKHKQRVLKKPSIYINFLKATSIAKYSSAENAKIYLPALLPEKVGHFWNRNFFSSYEYILNLLPVSERFGFLKKKFNDKYPEQLFEMNLTFYAQQCFKLMTAEEKEKWALDHIASQKEILGAGKDYVWYKFIRFDKAFEEIKRLIMITSDSYKRAEIVHILVESAKTQRDLEKLFKYYYDRHNNELRPMKENFIDWVIANHNVYQFDEECWASFDKIFQNLEVYSMSDHSCKGDFKIIALIYQIINKMEVHEALKFHIIANMYFYILKVNTDKLSKEQQEMVYQYLLNVYMDKITEFDSMRYDTDVKHQTRKFIYYILDLLHQYGRTGDDIPDVVMKLMKLDWNEFKYHKLHFKQPKKMTQDDLIRDLKTDAKLIVDKLPAVKKSIQIEYRFNIAHLLKKLKVYFPRDISQEYLKFFNELLSEDILYQKIAQAAIFGIFTLADDNFKVEFMTKHAPTESKVNRSKIGERLLRIQEAICSTALYSRPPVPLKNMLMYLKGDYVPSCLPLFSSYMANLPLPLCMELVEVTLDKPLSIQKHGIRLAFVFFSAVNLKQLITKVWKKTKNVSLRKILYRSLYKKIVDEKQNAPSALVETLTAFTLDLHQEDDNEVFDILTSGGLAEHLTSDYLNAVWTAVSALPSNNITNLVRKTNVIKHLSVNVHKIQQDVIRPIVSEFVKDIFSASVVTGLESRKEAITLYQRTWDLTAKHITFTKNRDDLEVKLDLAKFILSQCLNKFKEVGKGKKYVGRDLGFYFLRKLRSLSYEHSYKCYEYINLILEHTLQMLIDSLPIEDIYKTTWEIHIDIAARRAVSEFQISFSDKMDKAEKFRIVREVFINFGADIGNLIKDFIDKDMYFNTFLPNVHRTIKNETAKAAAFMPGINSDDGLVITGFALMEFKTTDVYLFALNIMPSEYSGQYVEDYESVLRDIKELDNIEIKCLMYEKFVNNNSNTRAFL